MDVKENAVFIISFILIVEGNGEIFSQREENDVEAFVKNIITCRNIPGLTLSVVKGDETWARGFGVADIKLGTKVTNETLFAIGSLGKAFTMTLLGGLIKAKGYTWDTKLSDIQGLNLEFVDENITREATLADLLAHKTGLSDASDFGFIAGYPSFATRAFMSRRTKFIPKEYGFRTMFVYNNMMYMLLGYVTELLGNGQYDDLLTTRVLEPIGMKSSKILKSGDDVQGQNVAKPYIMPMDKIEDGNYDIYRIAPLEPAGGILSNAVDMAKWMRFNLQNGTTETGRRLISEDLLSQAFKDQMALPYLGIFSSIFTPYYPINDTTKSYGYAWFPSNYRGHRRLWHSGGLFSYVSLLWLYPDRQIGIFGNVNGLGQPQNSGDALKVIFAYVSDILLKEEKWLDMDTACSFPSPWVNSTAFIFRNPPNETLTSYTDLETFTGTYGTQLLPDITILVKDGDEGPYLWLEMNRIEGKLLPTTKLNQFKFQMKEPWEYAVEHMNLNRYVTWYPVSFKISQSNSKAESFTFEFGRNEVLTFKKNVRFLTGEFTSGGGYDSSAYLLYLISGFIALNIL